ncbi:MAG: hypothetical protein EOP51_06955 [Sphingobacteriales bacterium]|nr:MAG: hypothetical protein EOP51_06955 [Sphingobacteriales bacterium]
MEKLDLAKLYKPYYTAKAKPELVDIERAQYLSITGKGDPSGDAFATSVQGIYATAYDLKFHYKAEGKDFVVAKLEGLWHFDEQKFKGVEIDDSPNKVPRSEWEYSLLIRLPEYVCHEQVKSSIENVVLKKGIFAANEVEYFEMREGKCVQMLHVGPFDKEPETLKQIKAFCDEHELKRNGLHHEIYLSDFRKTAPEKLRTILREPVK